MKKPQYVHGFLDRHGKPRFYLRRPGHTKQIPLPGLPWSPEFMAAYETAMNSEWGKGPAVGSSRTTPGTVNAAIVSYYDSRQFQAFALGTQKMRRAILERFRQEHGQKRLALLATEHLEAILAKKKSFAAKNWLKTLRGLLAFSVATKLLKQDPSAGIQITAPKSEGFHTWSEDEIAQYRACHPPGTPARLALELLLGTGQSRADVVLLGRQHIRNGEISIRRKKTKEPAYITVLPELAEAIASCPVSGLTFLMTTQGKPYTKEYFGNWFRSQCDTAGLPHCAAHGLRKAAATRFAEAGVTTLSSWRGSAGRTSGRRSDTRKLRTSNGWHAKQVSSSYQEH